MQTGDGNGENWQIRRKYHDYTLKKPMAVIATQGSKFQCFQTEELSLVLVFFSSCKKLISMGLPNQYPCYEMHVPTNTHILCLSHRHK